MTSISTRQELTARIQMLNEAIADVVLDGGDASKQTEMRDGYQAHLDSLEGDGNVTITPDEPQAPRSLTDRPKAGAATSNQYGTFQVHYCSAKQTAFIKGLLDRKDTSSLEGSVILDVARLREQVAAQEVNKKAASAIIDRLLALPDRTVAPHTGTEGRPATEKQFAFITRLAGEKDLAAEDRAKVLAAVEGKTLSAKGASATIEKLLALPKAIVAQTAIEAGVYVNTDGSVYRVYFGQNSGQMLAAKVEDNEFVYAGKADRFVTATSRKMTIEEAAAWGKATGTCIVCARRLDVPESVDRGIGPVCFAKMGG